MGKTHAIYHIHNEHFSCGVYLQYLIKSELPLGLIIGVKMKSLHVSK